MKHLITCFLIILGFSQVSHAQQFPYLSGFTEVRHIWNPAEIAYRGTGDVGLYARQQWVGLGFDTAPRFVSAYYQRPFEDYNMSAGLNIYNDKTGPTSSTGAALQYAYHLQEVLGRYSKLSFGIVGSINSFAFDPTDEVYNDIDDPLLAGGRNSDLFPSIGGGISYMSSSRYFRDNSIFIGFSAYQAYATNVLVSGNNFSRQLHFYGHIGSNIPFLNSRIEPSLTINYTEPELVDFILNAKYEVEELLWGGLSVSSVGDLFFQAGYIVPNFGNGYGLLKIGAMGGINLGSSIRRAGPGFELFLNYSFDD